MLELVKQENASNFAEVKQQLSSIDASVRLSQESSKAFIGSGLQEFCLTIPLIQAHERQMRSFPDSLDQGLATRDANFERLIEGQTSQLLEELVDIKTRIKDLEPTIASFASVHPQVAEIRDVLVGAAGREIVSGMHPVQRQSQNSSIGTSICAPESLTEPAHGQPRGLSSQMVRRTAAKTQQTGNAAELVFDLLDILSRCKHAMMKHVYNLYQTVSTPSGKLEITVPKIPYLYA
jgi:hypothetical protein